MLQKALSQVQIQEQLASGWSRAEALQGKLGFHITIRRGSSGVVSYMFSLPNHFLGYWHLLQLAVVLSSGPRQAADRQEKFPLKASPAKWSLPNIVHVSNEKHLAVSYDWGSYCGVLICGVPVFLGPYRKIPFASCASPLICGTYGVNPEPGVCSESSHPLPGPSKYAPPNAINQRQEGQSHIGVLGI